MRRYECGGTIILTKTDYSCKNLHDGILQDIFVKDMPAYKCDECGEVCFDNHSSEAMSQALRDFIGLLSPTEIKTSLRLRNSTTKALCLATGIPSERVSRILRGLWIQSEADDALMRDFLCSD